jgi:hypothetical protein
MMSSPHPPQRRAETSYHYKDPSLNTVQAGSTSSTTTTTSSSVAATTESAAVTTTTEPPLQPHIPYPLQPSTRQAVTTHSLYGSNNNDNVSPYQQRHYLTSTLSGKLWWDINSDAKRGSYANGTLNEMEYDYGIPNVGNILLVSCEDEEKDKSSNGDGSSNELLRGSTTSLPYNGREAVPLLQSLDTTSGMYQFRELDNIPSGRYYIMFESPINWRISGNVLPLGRKKGIRDGEVYYECVPEGGEGVDDSSSFHTKAKESGDFDYGGYCGRSIGCLEVGTRMELEEKFVDLVDLKETEYYQTVIRGDGNVDGGSSGTGGKMVALPDPRVMDVGMAQQEWPLPAKQYADAIVTLRFPVSATGADEEDVLEKLLSQEFADAERFGKSSNQATMSKTLYKTLANQFAYMGSGGLPKHQKGGGSSMSELEKFAQDTIVSKKDIASVVTSENNNNLSESEKFAGPNTEAAIFALDGIDLFDAKIERKKHTKDSIGVDGRYLRASRNAQESDSEMIEITYTFTARGTYRPPPHEQLGHFVQNSINADPTELVRTLREDSTLPFQNLESVESSHLTIGPPAPKLCPGCFGLQAVTSPEDGGLKSWAEVPVILMSLMIVALSFVFFGRRVWKRRRYLDVDDMQCEMKTQDFATSDHDIDAEKNMHRFSMEDVADGDSVDGSIRKKKKRKNKKKLNSSSDRTGSTRSIDASNSTQSDNESKSSSSVRKLHNSISSSSTREDLDDGIKTTKKKNKKKLDGSNRSGTSDYSRSTNQSHLEESYENETEEERRRRRKKEKKARKRAEKEAMLGNDSPPSLDELCFQ